MKVYMFFLSTMIVAMNAYAQPNEIDVIGIVPGVSTERQVEAAKAQHGLYIIGGFGLDCASEYIDNHLSLFLCDTGKRHGSTDETKEVFTAASNLEIHTVLVKGFTKKFGPPTSREENKVSNRLGISFNQEAVEWRDKKGNSLLLFNIIGNVTQGALQIWSSQRLKMYEQKQEAANNQRAF
jgi:hypothetical protein